MSNDTFDPLVEFAGRWTTDLAERYLPIEGRFPTNYECWDGDLIMTPKSGVANSYATVRLGSIVHDPAERAGYPTFMNLGVRFTQTRWLGASLAVTRQPIRDAIWAPAELVLMVVEFVRPASVDWDTVDKPARCATAHIPYYLWVDVRDHNAHLELLRLNDAGCYVPQAKADLGQVFHTDVPFPFSFDTAQLLAR